jgi:hypothetical protein
MKSNNTSGKYGLVFRGIELPMEDLFVLSQFIFYASRQSRTAYYRLNLSGNSFKATLFLIDVFLKYPNGR